MQGESYSVYERLIAPEERQLVQPELRPSSMKDPILAALGFSVAVPGMGLIILCGGANLLLGKVYRPAAPFALFAFPVLYIPTAVITFVSRLRDESKRHRASAQFRESLRSDLESGLVQVTRLRALAAVKIAEREDEGPKFCFRIDPSHTLLLRGEELRDYEEQGFPWTDFELVRLPKTKWFLRLICRGEPMTDVMELGSEADQQVHEEGEVFELNWSKFVRGEASV